MSRRAPRLDARSHIGRHLERRGRFGRIDPLRPRPLPPPARLLGVLGWAGLLGYAGWQAWRRREPAQAPGLAGSAGPGVPDSG